MSRCRLATTPAALDRQREHRRDGLDERVGVRVRVVRRRDEHAPRVVLAADRRAEAVRRELVGGGPADCRTERPRGAVVRLGEDATAVGVRRVGHARHRRREQVVEVIVGQRASAEFDDGLLLTQLSPERALGSRPLGHVVGDAERRHHPSLVVAHGAVVALVGPTAEHLLRGRRLAGQRRLVAGYHPVGDGLGEDVPQSATLQLVGRGDGVARRPADRPVPQVRRHERHGAVRDGVDERAEPGPRLRERPLAVALLGHVADDDRPLPVAGRRAVDRGGPQFPDPLRVVGSGHRRLDGRARVGVAVGPGHRLHHLEETVVVDHSRERRADQRGRRLVDQRGERLVGPRDPPVGVDRERTVGRRRHRRLVACERPGPADPVGHVAEIHRHPRCGRERRDLDPDLRGRNRPLDANRFAGFHHLPNDVVGVLVVARGQRLAHRPADDVRSRYPEERRGVRRVPSDPGGGVDRDELGAEPSGGRRQFRA